ncbi:MAG: NAD(P)/FAD-dependent oxidoreductase [Planctomycetota bacterium]|nr:NAD(P)/FAD-dependent oxidoreductase [Planctomycetota bacterium]MDA1211935.1 NAD(P)/FAD-dependent oxidoreductase [Planctomycetota bacterium]
MDQQTAIIIGAGPAGLTAAFELLERTSIKPVIFEMSSAIGGLSQTVKYKGNRIDIGGHRFFSKSDRVMDWWRERLPIQGSPTGELEISYQNKSKTIPVDRNGPDAEKSDLVMLIRSRLSRIFYLRSFFNYPISLSKETVLNLGIVRMVRIMLSYLKAAAFPIRNERSLEDFLINRFGRELYLTFFKDYTEKVWGAKCTEISAEWGAQRIKGLSITKTILHALRKISAGERNIEQKQTETSLIEQFLYPKHGPGQMWEETARLVLAKGGELHLNSVVERISIVDGEVTSVFIRDTSTNDVTEHKGNYVFSTMPVKELVQSLEGDAVPEDVERVAKGLLYRDFITVGLLLKKLNVRSRRQRIPQEMVPDNWIYIQERDVKIGRLQIFNNWSPYLVKSPDTVWLGLEYFCNIGDELWSMSDEEFKAFAIEELIKIDFIAREDVLDATIIRMPKTYPAYFGTYNEFHVIREHLDQIENLFLIGRNGMHKYNNADHSMLTAMTAVDNIVNGIRTKDNIWQVNTEAEYHEKK